MSNLEKLAKLFADRTNPTYINIAVGSVISESPLRVQYGESIILDESHLVIANHVLNGYKREIEITDVQTTPLSSTTKIIGTMAYTDSLKVGDQVILIPDNDFKKWYLLDKVGSV